MAISVRKITLWRNEVENRPGTLANTLEPLANAGVDLRAVMGYRYPGEGNKAAVELYPVSGKKAASAAQSAGLSATSIPTLVVEGDNRPGLGAQMARGLADAGINLSFLVAQVVGRRYSALVGFETDADAKRATGVIKKATASKPAKKGAGKKKK